MQLFGALGVTSRDVRERLYREIRALRIYEGASEVQQLVIAGGGVAMTDSFARDGNLHDVPRECLRPADLLLLDVARTRA